MRGLAKGKRGPLRTFSGGVLCRRMERKRISETGILRSAGNTMDRAKRLKKRRTKDLFFVFELEDGEPAEQPGHLI